MFKKLFNPIGFLREVVLRQFFPFTWSERERQALEESGFTDGEILVSEAINNVGMPFWIKRTIK